MPYPFGMLPEPEEPDLGVPFTLEDLQPPQEPMPQDFWARLAQGSGPQPFSFDPGRKPTGLEVLLSLASGIGNVKARQGATRVSETQQRNLQAREAAKTLATWRHQERLKKQEIGARREALDINEQYRRDKLAMDAADAALRRGDQQEWRRIMEGIYRDRIAASRERAGLGVDGAGAATSEGVGVGREGLPSEIRKWVERVETGQAKLTTVPLGLRSQVNLHAGMILPDKARDTIKEVNAARAILSSLTDLSGRIPRGAGMGRFKQGLRSRAAGIAQTPGLGEDVANYQAMADGMLANISRATGERGVLTNQDIDRVRKNIPSVNDTEAVSRNKLKNIDNLFSEFQQRAITTYTSKGEAIVGGAVSPAGEEIELVRDPKTGKLVRKQ